MVPRKIVSPTFYEYKYKYPTLSVFIIWFKKICSYFDIIYNKQKCQEISSNIVYRVEHKCSETILWFNVKPHTHDVYKEKLSSLSRSIPWTESLADLASQ